MKKKKPKRKKNNLEEMYKLSGKLGISPLDMLALQIMWLEWFAIDSKKKGIRAVSVKKAVNELAYSVAEKAELEGYGNALKDFEKIRSITYEEILKHRRKCPKWKNRELCLQCWGGGLTRFTNNMLEYGKQVLRKGRK